MGHIMPDDESNSVLMPGEPDDLQLRLSGQQRLMYEVLTQLEPVLARMYLGALASLAYEVNPERFVHAAHSCRELMEKLPRYLEVSIQALSEKMGDKVYRLADSWQRAMEHTDCYQEASWNGDIDPPLRRLLLDLACFFEWLNLHQPRRSQEIAAVLDRLDVSGGRLPASLENRSVRRWIKLNGYFQAVAHHHKVTSIDVFMQRLSDLESLLLDRVRPQTYADFDLLDEIIREGESDA